MNENLIKKIANHYGVKHQNKKAIEEMSELTVALCKVSDVPACDPNVPALLDDVIEEIADVIIMMEQLKYFYGSSEVDREIERKINRQIERMSKGD